MDAATYSQAGAKGKTFSSVVSRFVVHENYCSQHIRVIPSG